MPSRPLAKPAEADAADIHTAAATLKTANLFVFKTQQVNLSHTLKREKRATSSPNPLITSQATTGNGGGLGLTAR